MAGRNDEIRVKLIGDKRDLERALSSVESDAVGLEATFKDVGSAASKALQAGVAAGGAAVVATLDDARVSAGKLEAQIGGVGGASQAVGDIATKVYRNNFGASMGEAFQLTGMVSSALNVQGKELQGLTEDVFTISDAFEHVGIDAQGLVSAIRPMQSAFPGVEEAAILDRIALSLQRDQSAGEDLLDTLQEYAPTFSHINLDAGDMFDVIDAGMAAGARNTDLVADAVKELDIRLNTIGDTGEQAVRRMFPPAEADRIIQQFRAGGDEGEAALAKIMQQVQATSSEQERYNLMVDLFGTKAEDLAGGPIEAVVAALAETEGKTSQVADVTAGMQAQYTGWANQLEGWKRAFQVSVLDRLGALPSIAGGAVEAAGSIGTALFGLSAAGFDVSSKLKGAFSAIRNLSLAGFGPLGIALGAGTIALGLWLDEKRRAEEATAEFTQAIVADSGAIGDNTNQLITNRIQKSNLI